MQPQGFSLTVKHAEILSRFCGCPRSVGDAFGEGKRGSAALPQGAVGVQGRFGDGSFGRDRLPPRGSKLFPGFYFRKSKQNLLLIFWVRGENSFIW